MQLAVGLLLPYNVTLCLYIPIPPYLSLSVYPLHSASREEGEDKAEGTDEVPREGVDEGHLFKHH